ncbi:alpha/beta hydrolase [Halalkalibacter alkalisediminis]|uniref:Alpha/beta hydrolase n=1 Tax=Halalkalibacter alkalisediminis TaxID=935616 RepID=A0ABV6NCL3_9BACI|nr:alpha/beta hydrolase [Halalkalibacter alkalisediminis]
MEKKMWIPMSDNHEIFVYRWSDETVAPRAIIQIAHGMAEHGARYQTFAEQLVVNGIMVYANDHRGHGRTGEKSGLLGHFNDENGFDRAVTDLKEINEFIHHQHQEVPVFLLGHSMGSFLVRRFIQKYQGVVEGAIISGTGGDPGIAGKLAKNVVKSQIRKLGKQKESPLLNKLVFGHYNKKIKSPKTEYDWLSRDKTAVQKYIDDPLCGFIPTAGFFEDLFEGLELIHQDEEVKKIEKDLPFFFFSGDQDPLGKKTKAVLNVIHQYKKQGIRNIQYKFYKKGRHEMLNEVNRDDVTLDIIKWVEQQL